MKRSSSALIALFVAILSTPKFLTGQETSFPGSMQTFTIVPYVGAIAYDVGERSLDDVGFTGGVRLGIRLGSLVRFTTDAGYAEINGVGAFGTPDDKAVVGENQWRTTAGVEIHVIDGPPAASIAFDVGAIFDKFELEGTVGDPEAETIDAIRRDDWSPTAVAIPAVVVQNRLSSRVQLRMALEDRIDGFLETDDTSHNLVLTTGLAVGL